MIDRWIITSEAPSLRTVGIIGAPESGKTTTAYCILKKWRRAVGDCEIAWYDNDRRIPESLKVRGVEEVFVRLKQTESENFAVAVTDPRLALAWGEGEHKKLSSFVENLWTARHANPRVKHLLFVFAGQTVTAIAPKIRNLFHVWIIKSISPADITVLAHQFGLPVLRTAVRKLNTLVFQKARKDLAIVVFPNGEWCFASFKVRDPSRFEL